MKLINAIPGRIYLWIAVILFATSNSIVRKLTEIGAEYSVAGRNPISPCNVLFVSNICALMVLMVINYRQLNFGSVKQISRKEWLTLITVAILAGALAPGLIFQALTITRVTNVILVGRIEPPLILALSVLLLRERINRWEIAGAFVCFAGVFLTIWLQGMGMGSAIGFGNGEVFTLVGVSAAAIATIISKAHLDRIPLGIFNIIRTLIGTIVFFGLASYLYGSQHFAEAFSPFLWQWMLVYGTVIVALGQYSWSKGLRTSNVSDASLANSFSPIAGILAAYLILNEKPGIAEYIGGSLIICGLLLSQIGIWKKLPKLLV